MNTPDPLLLLAVQIMLSFLTFGLATKGLSRRLGAMPRERALELLLWPHAFRYLPLGLLAPEQSSREIALSVLSTIALGDLMSGLLALAALVMLVTGAKTARAWVWIFSVVSVIDIGAALAIGLGNQVYRHSLGVSWYVLTLYVPLICIAQAMILVTLLKKSPSASVASDTFATRRNG